METKLILAIVAGTGLALLPAGQAEIQLRWADTPVTGESAHECGPYAIDTFCSQPCPRPSSPAARQVCSHNDCVVWMADGKGGAGSCFFNPPGS